MLVLTRKLNQVIRINDNIIIQIVDVDGRNVKLGIDAPRDVSVHREEIYQRIKVSENTDSSQLLEENDMLEEPKQAKNPVHATK